MDARLPQEEPYPQRVEQDERLKLLVFDMGHVLIDFEWNEVLGGFGRRTSASEEQLRNTMIRVGAIGYEVGSVTTREFLEELNDCLSSDIDEEEFTALWNHTFRENLEMAELLKELKDQYPLYLLSNTNDNHYRYIQDNFDVARHFEELILSYQVGSAKPDDEIYHEVLRRSGVAPDTVLFVDDLEANVESARRLGMKAHLFSGAAGLKEELCDQFGICL